MRKYLWFTDLHLEYSFAWQRLGLVNLINKEDPKAVFITGDISNGIFLERDLSYLASNIKCNIYFIIGNHDVHFSSFYETGELIKKVCNKYKNLIWLSDNKIIEIEKDVGLIGVDGWYDCKIGNPNYVKYTFDWFLIRDFLKKNTMQERFDSFKLKSKESAKYLKRKLKEACKKYKTVYILTHMPPWKNHSNNAGSFWTPYNTNCNLGESIEKFAKNKPNKDIIVLSGHTHYNSVMRISKNIICFINEASYLKVLKSKQIIII